jgi:hypothetical protein
MPTTGGTLITPPRAAAAARHLCARAARASPSRLTPPRAHPSELPIWKAAAILLSALALVVAFEITVASLVAYLVTGSAY